MRSALAFAFFALVLLPIPATADGSRIILKGQAGCGFWLAQRNIHASQPLEQLVAGYLDGLSLANKAAFWEIGEGDERTVYSWMDAYCTANVTKTVFVGAEQLFVQRTGSHEP